MSSRHTTRVMVNKWNVATEVALDSFHFILVTSFRHFIALLDPVNQADFFAAGTPNVRTSNVNRNFVNFEKRSS